MLGILTVTAVNKSSSNADLHAITDALVDQYDEGMT